MNIKEKVKKQHYVSKFYLKNWFTDKKQLKVITKNNNNKKFNPTNLDSIAQQRFFYKVDITQNVFDLLLSRYYNNNLCKDILQEMQVLLKIDKYKKEERESFEKLDIININILEEKYSKIESHISPVIEKIENNIIQYINDLILNKENIHILVDFYFLQLYRTKKMRNSLNKIMSELHVTKNNITNKLSDEEKENFITIMQFIDPIVEVEKFYKKKFSIELIINSSKLNFYTSDAPAFITTKKEKEISEIEGFMALTPKVGMIIRGYQLNKKILIFRQVYNKKIIARYNKVIYGNADSHIYCTM
jgi:hypothetical protein